MKNFITIILSVLCMTSWASNSIYLSTDGCDKSSGSENSPIYSLSEAMKRIEAMNSKDTVYVIVKSGRYFMEEPLMITNKISCPVVFISQSDEKPEFIGGIEVKGWQKYKDNIWRTYIPEVKRYGYSFEQFYINGKRAVRARTPNTEWNYVLSSKENGFDKGARSFKYGTQAIFVKPEELEHLKSLSEQEQKEISLMFYHKWDITRKNADYISPDSGRININGIGMRPWNIIGKGSRYILENYKSALDAKGEWFLDNKDGYLYYIPRDGENMSSAVCYAPANSKLIVIRGNDLSTIRDIRFNNLAFKVSSYRTPKNGNEAMQAAAPIEAAIEIDLAENIVFENCEVAHTGAYAFWLRQEVYNNKIEHCYIHDLGAGGIKIGEPQIRENGKKVTSENIINNNIIQHAGYVFPCGVGVAIFNASDNKITHNEISDLRYSGVSIGWMWGYAESGMWTTTIMPSGLLDFKFGHFVSPAVRNEVEYNHIHHIGWGELSDMGAVYTLGESPGTRVCNNVIHDIYSYDYGGWGLYTDEGSTGVVMSNNLVWGCKSGGFHQHYGKGNIIKNNIFAFGHYYQLQFTRVEPHQSFSFKHNIILQDCGVNISGNWKDAIIDMDYNCYYDIRGKETKFGDMTLDQWKTIKDKHSIVADPMFVDAPNLNFKLKSNKIVKKIGFVPFDYSKAGVYGSQEWIDKAKLDKSIVKEFERVILKREKDHSCIYSGE